MKIITIASIILCISLILFAMRKKINKYLNKDIEKIKELNYTNEEIEYYILKYSKADSGELLDAIKNKDVKENEFRAIRKILDDRNIIIPTSSNFS